MLASITPLGERGRGSMWGVTVTAFAVGGTAAGALAGGLSGALGAAVLGDVAVHARLALLAAAVLAAAVLDARGAVPGPRRQVDEGWLDAYRGWVYGLGFGAQLGLGLTTVVTSAATYAAMLAALLSASPIAGAAIVGCFGAVRGLTPLLAAGIREPRELIVFHTAMARWRTPSRWLAVTALAGAAVCAAAGALT
jgi:hypothetical protein